MYACYRIYILQPVHEHATKCKVTVSALVTNGLLRLFFFVLLRSLPPMDANHRMVGRVF